ncbi:hypothetical protein TARUN_6421 [Trichoderma arundinaceum]|uniref:Uncharacterized protein n=1 Tax=Trichoderma arundinaceum TaxID=490622 RepID=A0A395NIE8_TRIAR|nr:hypothetical protein TARUN_6421 [Trichoderma arundinaceum]
MHILAISTSHLSVAEILNHPATTASTSATSPAATAAAEAALQNGTGTEDERDVKQHSPGGPAVSSCLLSRNNVVLSFCLPKSIPWGREIHLVDASISSAISLSLFSSLPFSPLPQQQQQKQQQQQHPMPDYNRRYYRLLARHLRSAAYAAVAAEAALQNGTGTEDEVILAIRAEIAAMRAVPAQLELADFADAVADTL